MELKDYTTEQLKAELKRRAELAKSQKAEEMKNYQRCRNCKQGNMKEEKWIRRCPECGNYLFNRPDCDSCGWPYHVPIWGINPGTGIFDRNTR